MKIILTTKIDDGTVNESLEEDGVTEAIDTSIHEENTGELEVITENPETGDNIARNENPETGDNITRNENPETGDNITRNEEENITIDGDHTLNETLKVFKDSSVQTDKDVQSVVPLMKEDEEEKESLYDFDSVELIFHCKGYQRKNSNEPSSSKESIEMEQFPSTSDIRINMESSNEDNGKVLVDKSTNTIDNQNTSVDNTVNDILNVLLPDFDESSMSSDSADSNADVEEVNFKKIVVISEGLQFAAGNEFFFDDNSFADTVTCLICFSTLSGFDIIYCTDCDLRICLACMEAHIKTKIREGLVRINCAGEACNRGFSNQLIAAFAPKLVPIYVKNQVELENNPNRKTCPNCHKIETCHDWDVIEKRKITCNQCSLLWCFFCHAPWHSGLKCENFTKDAKNYDKKALKFWAKNKGTKTRNATKCPTCNFYIERISGCDHMTCMRCKTSFCYRCGEKYRSLGWLGDHYSTYSFLGCKYNLSPNKPVRRVAIRSCCTVGAVVGCTVLAGIALPVCAVAIVFSPIIFSCYLVNKKC